MPGIEHGPSVGKSSALLLGYQLSSQKGCSWKQWESNGRSNILVKASGLQGQQVHRWTERSVFKRVEI